MANESKCQTPGALYSSRIRSDAVSVTVRLPFEMILNAEEAEQLETNLHNAIEQVLAKYF